ncbi:MAG: sulfatase-like hydrolase/transferase [Rhodanobacteraceae bacterium]|jgi:uncharacterized membrane protein|nr:sulfatase-like hydrolase/transferase [Rhodanobacteraceae bacterium]
MDWLHTRPRTLAAILIGACAFTFALWRLLPVETDPTERLYCAALAGALALFLATLCGRLGFGLFAVGALAGALWLANALKIAYLHEPLLAPDLRYFATTSTVDVIAHYPKLWHKTAAALLGGVLLAVTLWRLETPGRWRGRRRAQGLWSLLALLPLVAVAAPQGLFREIQAVNIWEFLEHARRNPTSSFLYSLTRMQLSVPAYAPDAAGAFDWGAGTTAAPAQRPDIVAVLEESTLDPRQWAACTVPACNVALFEPDAHTAAYGPLRVHTYGGATWTSEFAFLAGMPHTLFGPAGMYAPYNLAPRLRESLPRQLKALGYRTIAVYPMPRDFVRAAGAYADYGFDEFHDAQEMGLRWESTDLELLQQFDAIRQRARASDGRPIFFMLLTMRQHGPHDLPLDTLPPPWNAPPLPGADARLNRNLAHYLFRLHQSDAALARLRDSLFADDRPSVLVHFGDHHPSFDGLEGTLDSALPPALRADARNLTYYRIDTNLAGAALPPREGPLDLAFLGSLVLDAAGLPKNAYFEANARLRERCGGRFDDCPDRAVLESWMAHAFGVLRVLGE